MAYPVTPKLGLPLVPDGDEAWGEEMRQAMRTLDDLGGSSITSADHTILCSAATGSVALGSLFTIEKEVATDPGRFRLYRDAAGRDSDLTRAPGAPIPSSVGLLLEDFFTSDALTIRAYPALSAPSGGAECWWSWTGALGATITLSLTTIRP